MDASSAWLERLRELPAVRLLYATGLAVRIIGGYKLLGLRFRLGLARRWNPPIDALQMPERYGGRQVLSPRLIAAAHAHNVPVHIWTVDEVADMRRLLAWGVDGIITDRPDRLASVLHELTGRPLPPGPEPGTVPPPVERLLRA